MTHEQKPESAEFRTREAQLSALMGVIAPHQEYPMVAELLTRHIAEAEARGAAEQRRKDAEGQEPVGYRWAYDVRKGRDSLWLFGGDLPEPTPYRPEPKHVTPLYTRPANVAALEARVKELEGEKHANEVAAFERGFQGGRRDRYKQYERETAEAVAAERERCAKVCEERRETFADPAYAGGPIGAVSEMFACKACAAAIREGGEHG